MSADGTVELIGWGEKKPYDNIKLIRVQDQAELMGI